ncbi:MAG: murein biosynthesis integral membrane protein MurJ [Candidatus Eremiobacteraeota bacterium]|nr:murein biosynthesis integral membrane protein MurJ [Candidatus Eremiobacteraeota bacterium]
MSRPTGYLRAVEARPAERPNLAGSTLFVISATLGSALLGFLREVVNARYYGTRWEMDTFLAAATIPTILFGVFNGALVSALVPTFSYYLAHDREEEAWRLANTILNGLFLVLTACAILGYVFAPVFVPIVAHGFPAPQMGVAVHMTRWLMPSIVAVSLAGVVSALLNAYHRFRAASLVGIAINLVTIGTVILMYHKYGIFALVLGTTLGLVAQLLVQLPSLIAIGKYRMIIDLHHPGLRRVWMFLGPIIVGSAAGQAALFFDRYFASTLTPGYIAGMNYASKLVNFPQQVFGAAIATVIFPALASSFAHANRAGIRRDLTIGLRMVNLITIPSMFVLIMLAYPIVQTLFERGTFQASATQLTAGLLPWGAIGLVALAANVVLTRSCFACGQISWTVAISIFTVMINVILSLVWLPTLGAIGLLLANSISQSIQAVMLVVLVWWVVRGIDWRPLLISTVKVLFCSAVMVATLHWIQALGVNPPTMVARAWFLFGELSIAAAAFIAAARIVNVQELSLAFALIVQKFARALPSPPENREAPIA